MSKDLLAEATRALRETEGVSELEARTTRARVMSGLHQTRVRRRTRYALLLPIAATFVAASAWGAASGKMQLAWASIARLVSTPATPPSSLGSSARATVTSNAHTVAQPSIAPTPTEAPEPDAVQSAPASPLENSATPSAPHAAAQAASDPAFALYRAAHTAHFVDHDPARALAAWDAYLAAAPNGALSPEAHYNRALSLVRLGRNGEARSALEPFANGAYGGYRQAEASALLSHLNP